MSKEDIVKHAIICFAADGYEGTSITTILKKAKATKGQLYHHFTSKEDLFVKAAFNCHPDDSAGAFIGLSKAKTKLAYKKQFLQFGLQLITHYQTNKILAKFSMETMRVVSRNSKIAKKIVKKGDEQKPLMVKSIQHGQDIGAFNKKYDLEYIIFRIKSTLDTIILHNAMNTCMFDYTKMWKRTTEELFQ